MLTGFRSNDKIEPGIPTRKYVPLNDHARAHSPSSDDDEDFLMMPRARMSPVRKAMVFVVAVAITCLAVNGLLDFLQRVAIALSTKPANSETPCYCGNSAEEAKSLDCKYVPMAAAWLPGHCRDNYLEEEFNTLGPNPDGSWTYFADYDMNTTIDLNTISNFAGTSTRFYNEWEWHVMHCMFYWRKLHRAQFSDITIEPRFNTDGHISHCTRLILSMNTTSTTVSGVSMGDEKFSEVELRSPVLWDDVRDGYGNNPPPGYLNDVNS